MRYIISLFLLSLFVSCQGGVTNSNKPKTNQDSIPKSKYKVLEFMADDKPSIALIDTTYKNFAGKKDFPISLFVTVTTVDKTEKGHPTAKETLVFRTIEDSILASFSPLATCYIGKTTMYGYRDIIFYIAEKDQKQVSESLAAIQKKFPRIKSYVFEKDAGWEAVAEFYGAMDKVK